MTDSTYAWVVDTDHLTAPEYDLPDRKGTQGPGNAPDDLLVRLSKGEGHKWRCYDDDGILYYDGRYLSETDEQPSESKHGGCIGNLSEDAFGPLWDFAQPDAGAVTIKYEVLVPQTRNRCRIWLPL